MNGGMTNSKAGLAVFVLGLCFFLAVRFAFLGTIVLDRSIPIEPDDSYGYILKAAQIDDCFLQRCPALADLREQTTAPSDDPPTANSRYREYHRTLFQFHPLHSLILYILHKTGLSWEGAYAATQVVGMVLLGCAAAYFMFAVWGAGGAGIALTILALTLFAQHGLHTVVPSNLTTGLALALWAAMLAGRRNPSLIITVIVVMLAMHPMGRIYSATTLVLFALWAPRPWRQSQWTTLGLGALLIAAWSSLGYVLDRPALSISPYPDWASQQSIVTAVLGNTKVAYELAQAWVNNLGGRIEAGLLIIVAFLALPAERRLCVLTLTLVLAAMTSVGLLHNYPNYFGIALARLWIPFALILWGGVGFVTWKLLEAAAAWGGRLRSKGLPKTVNPRHILTPRGWMIAATAALGIVLIQSFAGMAFNGIIQLRYFSWALGGAHNYRFEPAQVARLLEASGPQDAILYGEEERLYYFLIYGALSRGAVYLPAVKNSKLEEKWLTGKTNLRYVVAPNPVYEGSLPITSPSSLEITSPSGLELSGLHFKMSNSTATEKTFQVTADSRDGGFAVPARSTLWVPIGEEIPGRARRILVKGKGEGLRLQGIRTSGMATLDWPWDGDLTLRASGAPEKPIRFSTGKLSLGTNLQVEVFDDSNANIIARILR